jgi:hypothetical protein
MDNNINFEDANMQEDLTNNIHKRQQSIDEKLTLNQF